MDHWKAFSCVVDARVNYFLVLAFRLYKFGVSGGTKRAKISTLSIFFGPDRVGLLSERVLIGPEGPSKKGVPYGNDGQTQPISEKKSFLSITLAGKGCIR